MNDVNNLGPFLILAVTIIWCVIDLRSMLAVALVFAIGFGADAVASAVRAFSGASRFWTGELMVEWPWEAGAAISAVLVIVAIWRLRRQALL